MEKKIDLEMTNNFDQFLATFWLLKKEKKAFTKVWFIFVTRN